MQIPLELKWVRGQAQVCSTGWYVISVLLHVKQSFSVMPSHVLQLS